MSLSYNNKICLIARDRPAKMMLLGGLGALGVGKMWFAEEKDSSAKFENWETVAERACPDSELPTPPEPEMVPRAEFEAYKRDVMAVLTQFANLTGGSYTPLRAAISRLAGPPPEIVQGQCKGCGRETRVVNGCCLSCAMWGSR